MHTKRNEEKERDEESKNERQNDNSIINNRGIIYIYEGEGAGRQKRQNKTNNTK